jgi:hypothetical protein
VSPHAIQPRLEPLEDRWLPSILTVTTTADSGPGSLRAALAAAAKGDTIGFDLPNPSTIHLTSGTLNVTAAVNIGGPGPSDLTIQGNGAFADFFVSGSGDTAISGLTITGGGNVAGGGGIGTGPAALLTLNNDVITGNKASDQGGGIDNEGGLIMTNCTVSGNSAVNSGGGIMSTFQVATTITGSTISGNVVKSQEIEPGGGGGGIWSDGSLTLINSTVSANAVYGAAGSGVTGGYDAYGGGLDSLGNGDYTILSCTFSGNLAEGGTAQSGTAGQAFGGGALLVTSGTIANCTFNGNVAVGGSSTSGGTAGNGVGGGIDAGASPSLVNCNLINCTIVGNRAEVGVQSGHLIGPSFGGGINTNGGGRSKTPLSQAMRLPTGPTSTATSQLPWLTWSGTAAAPTSPSRLIRWASTRFLARCRIMAGRP